MTLFHVAYTFDSKSFHTNLRANLVQEGKLNMARLNDLAKSTVKGAPEDLKRVLDTLGFDRDWLDDPDADSSQAYLWYTVALANAFRPCPSLSNNRFRHSHLLLEAVLPIAGWKDDEIHELVLGNRLNTLFDSSEDEVFSNNLTLYGGCLNIRDAKKLLLHLEASIKYFSFKTLAVQQAITKFTAHSNIQPDMLLNYAYQDALDMLRSSIERNEALYLLREA